MTEKNTTLTTFVETYSELEENILKNFILLSLENEEIKLYDISKSISEILNKSEEELFSKMTELRQNYIANGHSFIVDDKNSKMDIANEDFSDDHSDDHLKNDSDFDSAPYHEKLTPLTVDDIGKVFSVKVYKIKEYGAFCETKDGRTGLILKGFLTTEYVNHTEDYLELGDEFEAMVIPDRFDPNRVLLNAKAIGNITAIENR